MITIKLYMVILGIIYIIWTYYSYKLKHLFKEYFPPFKIIIPALWVALHGSALGIGLIYILCEGLHFLFHYPPFVELLNYQIYP